jgi:2-polyprenyl-3-methyl-5-hydroxy-6-metoxy-1,4-benzoquinol methylase
MVALDPKTDFENWNEVMAKRYDPDLYHHHPNRIVRTIEGWRTQKVLRFANVQAGERVVDLGCGAGNMLEMLPSDAERWGIDLSTFLLDKAAQRLGVAWEDPSKADLDTRDGDSTTRLVRGNLQALPETIRAQGLFDKAICSEVIEHLPDPGLALAQACTLLRPGATFVISVPDEKRIDQIKGALKKMRLLHRLFPALPEKMEDEWHLHCFDLPTLRKTVEGLPLREIRRAGIPNRFVSLRWVVAYERLSD